MSHTSRHMGFLCVCVSACTSHLTPLSPTVDQLWLKLPPDIRMHFGTLVALCVCFVELLFKTLASSTAGGEAGPRSTSVLTFKVIAATKILKKGNFKEGDSMCPSVKLMLFFPFLTILGQWAGWRGKHQEGTKERRWCCDMTHPICLPPLVRAAHRCNLFSHECCDCFCATSPL